MKTLVIVLLAATVAVLGAILADGDGTPAKARTPAGPPPSYAVSAHLGCNVVSNGRLGGGFTPGPCSFADATLMMVQAGQPNAYEITVINPATRTEPVPEVTVGFYAAGGAQIATSTEKLSDPPMKPGNVIHALRQDQASGSISVRVLSFKPEGS